MKKKSLNEYISTAEKLIVLKNICIYIVKIVEQDGVDRISLSIQIETAFLLNKWVTKI